MTNASIAIVVDSYLSSNVDIDIMEVHFDSAQPCHFSIRTAAPLLATQRVPAPSLSEFERIATDTERHS
jgi:hypothetical protein